MNKLLSRLAPYLWPLAVANLVANIGIVVTGGAVRLTGSGLGCPTWPRCTDESYVPHGELGVHGAIEFGNRMLTFALTAIAFACFLAALGAGHRRATRLSLVIGLGIPLQAVIGGITVLTDLNPWIVSFHFLLSMAMVMVCVGLLDELRSPDREAAPRVPRVLAWATLVAGWVVLYLGTVVTGAGPHAGDTESPRNGLTPSTVSHLHAYAVYALVALTVVLLVVALRGGHRWLATVTSLVLLIELLQGVLGWVQYALDLPVTLVALHMLGAGLLAAGLARIALAVLPHHAAHEPRPGGEPQPHAATRLP
ncbi:cytochrome c oxidase assembly protein subunit 15 [Nocardioides exalbidus]|uniref:Cytochrome c oxidase assembly protein subunit 15 n=1 Tax=Nocardioides exalbidus TaxID=402596 RepID=A0A1H4Z171_9ACTN|nr:COX15/CtaA family protein [Nocardioides exalbidus]SED23101.1 cytochrome c oxidase assembly protein subunit 15 [Nocardioides exalbidus]